MFSMALWIASGATAPTPGRRSTRWRGQSSAASGAEAPQVSLHRDGIDFDELDADLQGYNLIGYIVPQDRLDADATTDLQFSCRPADEFNETTVFLPFMTYDGDIHYELDFDQAGGYLSLQVQFNDYHFVSLSAFDVQISGEDA
jgi:hypothetical protein